MRNVFWGGRCACQKGTRDSVNCEQVRVPEGSACKYSREVALRHQYRPPSEAESTPAEEEKGARLRRGKTAKAGHEDTGGSGKEEKKYLVLRVLRTVNCYLCQ